MINLTHLLVSAILTGLLLFIVFPRVVYFLCCVIAVADDIAEYSQDYADDFSKLLITRLFFLCIYIIARVTMVVAFIPMIILEYLETFGGFIPEPDKE